MYIIVSSVTISSSSGPAVSLAHAAARPSSLVHGKLIKAVDLLMTPPPNTRPTALTCQLFRIFNQPAVIAVIGACLTAFRNLTRSFIPKGDPPRSSREDKTVGRIENFRRI